MPPPIDTYWQLRLERCKKALEKNNFTVFVAADPKAAGAIFLDRIFPTLDVKTASWGDSMTLAVTGVLDAVRAEPGIRVIETFDPEMTWEERNERRRHALLADLFFTGSNAVTETGVLVNLDMVGNRIAGLTFGPKHVVLFIGRNKIVSTLDDAMARIKHIAGPANAIRHPGPPPLHENGGMRRLQEPGSHLQHLVHHGEMLSQEPHHYRPDQPEYGVVKRDERSIRIVG